VLVASPVPAIVPTVIAPIISAIVPPNIPPIVPAVVPSIISAVKPVVIKAVESTVTLVNPDLLQVRTVAIEEVAVVPPVVEDDNDPGLPTKPPEPIIPPVVAAPNPLHVTDGTGTGLIAATAVTKNDPTGNWTTADPNVGTDALGLSRRRKKQGKQHGRTEKDATGFHGNLLGKVPTAFAPP
jgi:hypothetical protein